LPVLESLASEFDGRIRFAKLEIDREGELLDAFGASRIPTYVIFRDGKELDRVNAGVISWFLEQRLRWLIGAALQ